MDIAKVTSKGQLTVPKSVREKLELEPGSKVVFIQVGDELVVRNANSMATAAKPRVPGLYQIGPGALPAFRLLQEAFAGLADEEGIYNDEDLVEWMRRGSKDLNE